MNESTKNLEKLNQSEEQDTENEGKLHKVIPDSVKKFLRVTLDKFIPSDPTQDLQEIFDKLQKELPSPCIVLVGEPQVGKSSIARILTHSDQIKIGLGDGVPVTEHVRAYPFPMDSALPLWTFLDTPGVGTKAPDDESEDFAALMRGEIKVAETDLSLPIPHMLLACVRADDTELAILPWIKKWSQTTEAQTSPLPLLVVQTCLHRVQHPHPMPYPFGPKGSDLPEELKASTKDALHQQREKIRAYRKDASFVVVDLTDPEDEVGDPLYGAEALVETVMNQLPDAIVQMLKTQSKTFDDAFETEAQRLVWSYSVLAAGAGAIPAPFGDVATLSVALTMLKQLATQYRQPWELRTVLDLLWGLGSTTLLWLAARYFIRRIPIPILMAPVGAAGAFSLVFSVGQLMSWYYATIREGQQPTKEDIREYWKKTQDESKAQWKHVFNTMWKPENP